MREEYFEVRPGLVDRTVTVFVDASDTYVNVDVDADGNLVGIEVF